MSGAMKPFYDKVMNSIIDVLQHFELKTDYGKSINKQNLDPFLRRVQSEKERDEFKAKVYQFSVGKFQGKDNEAEIMEYGYSLYQQLESTA